MHQVYSSSMVWELNIHGYSKTRKFLKIRLSEIKYGGICAGCACHFESKFFLQITFSEIEFKDNFESYTCYFFYVIILGKLRLSGIE